MKTTVIYHRADFDGLFCREIARKFLPEAELIGWDYGDPKLPFPEGEVYVLDLSPECFSDFDTAPSGQNRLVWIDHHKSAIEKFEVQHKFGRGYRIDGVAACRLAWQWFAEFEMHNPDAECHALIPGSHLPRKQQFVERKVQEPLAVRLAGEYDIWDKRDPNAELFQHGLRTRELEAKEWGDRCYWEVMLSQTDDSKALVNDLLVSARYLQYAREQEYAEVIKEQGFTVKWAGLTFLACCSHELDIRSQLFAAGIRPEHDGLFGFTYTGKDWRVSLYGVPGKPDVDLAAIAVKYGGGGHKQACGFRTKALPFVTD